MDTNYYDEAVSSGEATVGYGVEPTPPPPRIRPGMVVRLRSGGPPMTVERHDTDEVPDGDGYRKVPNDRVVCRWFNGSEIISAVFHPDALEEVREEPKVTKTPPPRKKKGGRW